SLRQPEMADEVIANESFARAHQAVGRGDAAADHLKIIACLLKDGDLRRILLDILLQEAHFADRIIVRTPAIRIEPLQIGDRLVEDGLHTLAVSAEPEVLRKAPDP